VVASGQPDFAQTFFALIYVGIDSDKNFDGDGGTSLPSLIFPSKLAAEKF
jgi:hypothetical protein